MKNTRPAHGFFNRLKKLSLELVLLIIVFVLCLVMLLKVADMVFEARDTHFDENVFAAIHPYINGTTTFIMQRITFFGSADFLLPANILLVVIFLFIKKQRWYSLKIASVAITSTAVMFLLKGILKRQRPLVPLIAKVHGYSFPSGHSFSSLVFFGMLSYIIFRTVKKSWLKILLIIFCMLFTLLIGISRIYLEVHFASDVIAGFCLGTIWLVLARWLLVKAESRTPAVHSEDTSPIALE